MSVSRRLVTAAATCAHCPAFHVFRPRSKDRSERRSVQRRSVQPRSKDQPESRGIC